MSAGALVLTILLGNIAVFCASVLQTVSGFGFAMVAVPALALISLELVPGPSLVNSAILGIAMFLDERRLVARQETQWLIPAIALGSVAGALLIYLVPTDWSGIVIGSAILAAIAMTLVSRPLVLSPPILSAGGLIAGVMGTVSGIHGPPLAILYQHQPIAKVRATMALIFIVACLTSLAALAFVGAFDARLAIMGLSLSPGLIAGFLLARKVRAHLPLRVIRPIILTTATISALTLLWRSV